MSLTIFSLIILLFSVILHEIAHGSVALKLGDTTAKNAGRLTLNPLKHIDIFGTILLPLLLVLTRSPFVVGWAKPVPVNPYNFRDQRWGSLKVSFAGPAANLLIGVVFGLALRFLPVPASLQTPFDFIILYNFVLALFNLIPVPPLDGSHILFSFLPSSLNTFKVFLHQYGFFILLALMFSGVLNLVFRAAAFLYYFVAG